MLGWLNLLFLLAVLFHPTENIFWFSRIVVFVILGPLFTMELFLRSRRFNSLTAAGNIVIYGIVIAILTIFLDIRFFTFYVFIFGQILNFLVMLFNGGRMIVDPVVLEQVGRKNELSGEEPIHKIADETSRLSFLGDRWHIPPFSKKIISIGDMFITFGLFLTAIHMYIF